MYRRTVVHAAADIVDARVNIVDVVEPTEFGN